MGIYPTSWSKDGVTIDLTDKENQEAFLVAPILGNPNVEIATFNRDNNWPVATRTNQITNALILEILVHGDAPTIRKNLRGVFSTEIVSDPSGNVGRLSVVGENGESSFIDARVNSFREDATNNGFTFRAVLVPEYDVAFLSSDLNTEIATVDDPMENFAWVNNSNLTAYPTVEITPTSPGNVNPYRRFLAVTWQGNIATQYPIDVFKGNMDTRIASTNFFAADGSDIEFFVDGIKVDDVWIPNPNTVNTRAWMLLDFVPRIAMDIQAILPIGSLVLSLALGDAFSRLPDKGLLILGNQEIVTYEGKNNVTGTVTVTQRGAKGSIQAVWVAGSSAEYLEHDIEITYGSSFGSREPANDNIMPAFHLVGSTNNNHYYSNSFFDSTRPLSKPWGFGSSFLGSIEMYSGNEGAQGVNPVETLGAHISPNTPASLAVLGYFNHEVGVNSVEFQYEKYWNTSSLPAAFDVRMNGVAGVIAPPTSPALWDVGVQTVVFQPTPDAFAPPEIKFTLVSLNSPTEVYFGLRYASVVFAALSSPIVNIMPENSNVQVDLAIINSSLNIRLDVNVALELNQTLEMDFYNDVYRNKDTGETLFSGIRRGANDRPRSRLFSLKPNTSNDIIVENATDADYNLSVSWRDRTNA